MVGLNRRAGMRRVGTISLRFALVIVSTAVTLVGAELMMRWALRQVHSSGDARTYLAQQALPARANRLGFREHEIGQKHAYRIAIIGDSFTWGQGIPEKARFSDLIQQALGPRYEVLNFGRPGDDMPQHLDVLRTALGVAPDFILLQLFVNDFEVRGMVRPLPRPVLPWRSLNARLLRSSVLYDLLSSTWSTVQTSTGLTETYPAYMARYLENPKSLASRRAFGMLRQFVTRARAAGVPVGIVFFPSPERWRKPYPFRYLHDRVQRLCVQQQIRCVDLLVPFATSFPNPATMWVSRFDHHPNAAANQRAATAILREWQYVWDWRRNRPAVATVRRASRREAASALRVGSISAARAGRTLSSAAGSRASRRSRPPRFPPSSCSHRPSGAGRPDQ